MREIVREADATAEAGFRRRPGWVLVLAALLLAQTATTLTLFDEDRSGRVLRDERPIMSGTHPLHLYHGRLGAGSWRAGGFGSCYDPAFQAGYPKTPVFDSGSRPAELFLLIGNDRPAAYKIGLAAWCLLVPLVFAASVRVLEQSAATACAAALLGMLVWWGGPAQRLLETGQLDWLLAGPNLVLHAALTVRFHRGGGVLTWIVLALTAILGWFLHPILWLGFGLLFVPFLVFVATGHGPFWNLALLAAWGLGFLANLGWLDDWLRHCWIQMPLSITARESLRQGLMQWFTLDVGGSRSDGLFATVLLGGGLLGVVVFLIRRRVATGMTFGATAVLLPALSLGGGLWKPLEAIGLEKLFLLACCFATVPCAATLTASHDLLSRLTRHPVRGGAVILLILFGAGYAGRDHVEPLVRQALRARTLPIGLSRDQQTLVRTLRATTRDDARVLIEERANHPTPTWTAILPWHTGRHFLGGLGPDATVDHTHARLADDTLAGRPIMEWTDSELADFCTRYNVGYVICWSPATIQRWRAWSMTEPIVPVHEQGEGWLLAIKRTPSLVLKGKARIVQLDSQRIALADVEPDDGVVVLSLHYQEGFRIAPGDVQAEREQDPDDPIPRLRLRMPGPVLRLTLTWGKP